MFSLASVILSTTWGSALGGADSPFRMRYTEIRVNRRLVRILLECILVSVELHFSPSGTIKYADVTDADPGFCQGGAPVSEAESC